MCRAILFGLVDVLCFGIGGFVVTCMIVRTIRYLSDPNREYLIAGAVLIIAGILIRLWRADYRRLSR
jgi:hypothetical protein